MINPHFLGGNSGGAAYLLFIEKIFPGMLDVLPTEVRNEIWFQHDAHYSRPVRDILDQQFSNRLMAWYITQSHQNIYIFGDT